MSATAAPRIEAAGPSDAAEWDLFVRRQPGWTPAHLYGWRNVVERVHGHSCRYLVARRTDGAVSGVLPLARVRSRLFGDYLVSVPFLNYGGPLGDDESVRALAREATRMLDADGGDLLELRSPRELPLELTASHRKVTVLLEIPGCDTEALWNALRAKVRSQVRRPMKEGVEVRFGPDELEPFYRVFARHMLDLGTPVQPKELFEQAATEMRDTIRFGCGYLRGEPIAAGCGFRWEDRFELVWASALREHKHISANMLLYWRFMEECAGEGASVFDFGRCTPGRGTHKFKLQWGGRDAPLWWYQHGPRAGGGTPSADSGRYAWGPRIWRRLPLPVANALGPRVVRYIP